MCINYVLNYCVAVDIRVVASIFIRIFRAVVVITNNYTYIHQNITTGT